MSKPFFLTCLPPFALIGLCGIRSSSPCILHSVFWSWRFALWFRLKIKWLRLQKLNVLSKLSNTNDRILRLRFQTYLELRTSPLSTSSFVDYRYAAIPVKSYLILPQLSITDIPSHADKNHEDTAKARFLELCEARDNATWLLLKWDMPPDLIDEVRDTCWNTHPVFMQSFSFFLLLLELELSIRTFRFKRNNQNHLNPSTRGSRSSKLVHWSYASFFAL
jgi:hypothetical protein